MFYVFYPKIFKKDGGSFSLVPFKILKEEQDDTSSTFRVVFNRISLFWIKILSPFEKYESYSLTYQEQDLTYYLCSYII